MGALKTSGDMLILALVTIAAGAGYVVLTLHHADGSVFRDAVTVGLGALGGVAYSGPKAPTATP